MKVQKLRHWRHADADWFRDLDRKCFPYDEPFFNTARHHWWIVSNRHQVVGYAGLYVDGTVAYFCRAGVDPEWRRMGFHRALIAARIKWCRRHGITRIQTYAAPDNTRSIANLKAHGFKSRRPKKNEWVQLWRNL